MCATELSALRLEYKEEVDESGPCHQSIREATNAKRPTIDDVHRTLVGLDDEPNSYVMRLQTCSQFLTV